MEIRQTRIENAAGEYEYTLSGLSGADMGSIVQALGHTSKSFVGDTELRDACKQLALTLIIQGMKETEKDTPGLLTPELTENALKYILGEDYMKS